MRRIYWERGFRRLAWVWGLIFASTLCLALYLVKPSFLLVGPVYDPVQIERYVVESPGLLNRALLRLKDFAVSDSLSIEELQRLYCSSEETIVEILRMEAQGELGQAQGAIEKLRERGLFPPPEVYSARRLSGPRLLSTAIGLFLAVEVILQLSISVGSWIVKGFLRRPSD